MTLFGKEFPSQRFVLNEYRKWSKEHEKCIRVLCDLDREWKKRLVDQAIKDGADPRELVWHIYPSWITGHRVEWKIDTYPVPGVSFTTA